MLLLSHQIEPSNDLITISISLINHPVDLNPTISIQHNNLWHDSSWMCNGENMIEIDAVIVKRWQKCA